MKIKPITLRKEFFLWFLVLTIILLFNWQLSNKIFNQSQSQIPKETETEDSFQKPLIASPHTPIIIDGNTNLSNFPDKTGLGTENDPYIIQNFEISSLEKYMSWNSAILFCNVSDYLILRNIVVENIQNNTHMIFLIQFINCTNIRVESLQIRNCIINWGVPHRILNIFKSTKITITNVQINNVTIHHGDYSYIEECKDMEFDIYQNTHHGLTSTIDISNEFYILNSSNCRFDQIYLHESELASKYRIIYLSSYAINNTFEKMLVMNINSSIQFDFFFSETTSYNNTIQNNIFRDLLCRSAANELHGEKLFIINNQFLNIHFYLGGQVLRPYSIINSEFSSNIFDNINGIYDNMMCILFMGTCTGNTVFNNTFIHIYSQIGGYFSIWFEPTCSGNEIYYNRFMGAILMVNDLAGNNYSKFAYFPPLDMEMVYGNYWVDHHLDGCGELHYLIETPRIIRGNGNSTDNYPLHYFGMDFDQDGLINYYEDQYQLDKWNPDSDGDGVFDGDENFGSLTPVVELIVNQNSTNTTIYINETASRESSTTSSESNNTEPITTTTQINWSDAINNPDTILLISIAGLLVLTMFIKGKKI